MKKDFLICSLERRLSNLIDFTESELDEVSCSFDDGYCRGSLSAYKHALSIIREYL